MMLKVNLFHAKVIVYQSMHSISRLTLIIYVFINAVENVSDVFLSCMQDPSRSEGSVINT